MRAIATALALALLTPTSSTGSQPGELLSCFRSVAVHATSLDGPFDEYDVESAADSTRRAGPYAETLDVTASGFASAVNARAVQNGVIDAQAGTFDVRGDAVGSIYIQGQADTRSESLVRARFELGAPGKLTFTLVNLIVDDAYAGALAHDRPGDAEAIVALVEEQTGRRLFIRTLALDDLGTFDEILEEDPQEVSLTAGTYRLLVRARATDTTGGIDEVHFGLAAASFHVRGFVTTP